MLKGGVMNRYRKLCKTGVLLDTYSNRVLYVEDQLRKIVNIFELREEGLSYQKIADELGISSRDKVRGILNNNYYIKYYEEVYKHGVE